MKYIERGSRDRYPGKSLETLSSCAGMGSGKPWNSWSATW